MMTYLKAWVLKRIFQLLAPQLIKYMKDLITIGLPSKGRLKDKAISFFNDNGLKILQSEKERNYFGSIENKPNIKIIFLHAKEIIQRLGDGTLDIGVSGLDLLKESKNLREMIALNKSLILKC